MILVYGFLDGTSGKESTCQCKRYKKCGFDPWVGKIPLEKEETTHSSILACKIPRTEEPGRLRSLELLRVLNTHIFIGTWTYITKRDPLKFLAFNQLKIMPLSISENYVLNVILLSRNTHKTRLHTDQLTKMLWWGRKGTSRADSILKKKEIPSCTFSEHWTMYLVATGIIHLWLNWPPGLINTRFHTKISRRQKECNNPLCSQSPL